MGPNFSDPNLTRLAHLLSFASLFLTVLNFHKSSLVVLELFDTQINSMFEFQAHHTWGNTGFNHVRRTPCERAAMQAMAQDKWANTLEGAAWFDIPKDR